MKDRCHFVIERLRKYGAFSPDRAMPSGALWECVMEQFHYNEAEAQVPWVLRLRVAHGLAQTLEGVATMLIRPVVLASLVLLHLANQAASKEWSDASGQYTVEAEYFGVAKGWVRLKKADGSFVELPMTRLCEADQDFVHQSLPLERPYFELAVEHLIRDEYGYDGKLFVKRIRRPSEDVHLYTAYLIDGAEDINPEELPAEATGWTLWATRHGSYMAAVLRKKTDGSYLGTLLLHMGDGKVEPDEPKTFSLSKNDQSLGYRGKGKLHIWIGTKSKRISNRVILGVEF